MVQALDFVKSLVQATVLMEEVAYVENNTVRRIQARHRHLTLHDSK